MNEWFGKAKAWFVHKGDEVSDPFSGSGVGVPANSGVGNAIGVVSPNSGLMQSMGISGQMQQHQNAINQQYAALANQMGAQQLGQYDPGHSHGVRRKPEPSWGVSITKVENGFMVVVTDNLTGDSSRYIATDMQAVTDMIAVGLVTARLES
jgi:hypothetical protein